MGAQRAESRYYCTVAVQFRTILSSAYDVTITALRIVWICAIFSRTEIVLLMKYALRFGRALAIFSQEGENEILLIRGTRFLSIVFNFVDIRGVVQHKWLMVLICAMVQYSIQQCSIQLGFASLNQSFTSCEISYHCTINH